MLIDTHAHLNDARFDETRDEIISQLTANRIAKVFTVAYNRQSIIDSIALAEKYDNIYAIIGVHPEDADNFDGQMLDLIKQYATHPKVVAIGEIGLDYHYEGYNADKQKSAFVAQIKLAHQLQLPISIHNRDSIGDMLQILESHAQYLTYGGVMHCFSESVEVYQRVSKLGLKISFGGPLTFKNSRHAPMVCAKTDLGEILLETDCPYLTPHPYRGMYINEPKYTMLVAQKVAEIKNVPLQSVIEKTTNNALELFKKAN